MQFDNPFTNFLQNTAYATELVRFLEEYRFLFNMPAIKFFSNEAWNGMPQSWGPYLLEQMEIDSLESLCSGNAQTKCFQCIQPNSPSVLTPYHQGNCPETLKDFIINAKRLALSKEHVPQHNIHTNNDEYRIITRGMCPKKVHEVTNMAALTNALCETTHTNALVDIGAGEGYNSHFAARQFGLRAIAVEKVADFIEKGSQRAKQVDRLLQRYRALHKLQRDLPNGNFQFLRCLVNDANQFVLPKLVDSQLSQMNDNDDGLGDQNDKNRDNSNQDHLQHVESDHHAPHSREGYVLVGLHTCGNLSLMMMNLFLDSPNAAALLSIGCCYHTIIDDIGRMGTKRTTEGHNQFPYSNSVGSLKPQLTQGDFKAACQDEEGNLMLLEYRAYVEVVLAKYLENRCDYHIKRIQPHKLPCVDDSLLSFRTYLSLVYDRLLVRDTNTSDWVPSDFDLTSLASEFENVYRTYSVHAKELEVWIRLQSRLIQPVFESLVVMDRVLYLQEQGVQKLNVIPLFDPSISPRNFAIVAVK